MSLSAHIQRILNGLASAHAGDYLSRRQKDAVLAGMPPVSRADETVAPAATAERTHIALYLGSELPEEVMLYALRTCARMRYGLTVLTLQARKDAEALLDSHQQALAEAGIVPRLVTLSSEPTRALAQALRRRPEIAFLVCNESGYLGRSLLNGAQHVMPVPVVLVSQNTAQGDAADASATAARAARGR
jgi:hypothetical protein